MYKKIKIELQIVAFMLLVVLLTACTQQETNEDSYLPLDTAENSTNAEKEENSPNIQPDSTVDISNRDILAACAGTTVEQTIKSSSGGTISIDAQIDVDKISRVSSYRYIPMQFAEESRKTLLEKMFPAESWDVNKAAIYDEKEDAWGFVTPRGESWMYQIIDSHGFGEQIVDIERTDVTLNYTKESKICPIRISNEEDMMLLVEVIDSIPTEIERIGQEYINSVTDAIYFCNYIYICDKDSEHPYAKAVFKQVVDGMPITVWHNFSTATVKGSSFPVKVWGNCYSMEELGLEKPILTLMEAVAAIQEQIDSVQMQETQICISKINLEYLAVISSEGIPEIVPVWRFWIGNDEMERIMMCEQILAINAVNGELIWENRGAFTE